MAILELDVKVGKSIYQKKGDIFNKPRTKNDIGKYWLCWPIWILIRRIKHPQMMPERYIAPGIG